MQENNKHNTDNNASNISQNNTKISGNNKSAEQCGSSCKEGNLTAASDACSCLDDSSVSSVCDGSGSDGEVPFLPQDKHAAKTKRSMKR